MNSFTLIRNINSVEDLTTTIIGFKPYLCEFIEKCIPNGIMTEYANSVLDKLITFKLPRLELIPGFNIGKGIHIYSLYDKINEWLKVNENTKIVANKNFIKFITEILIMSDEQFDEKNNINYRMDHLFVDKEITEDIIKSDEKQEKEFYVLKENKDIKDFDINEIKININGILNLELLPNGTIEKLVINNSANYLAFQIKHKSDLKLLNNIGQIFSNKKLYIK